MKNGIRIDTVMNNKWIRQYGRKIVLGNQVLLLNMLLKEGQNRS
ncbi:hypothetical protein SAMN05421820_109282 [Pedobacter steynii]|uniref:Uncharacterized protein n=1 Tax=Pedobacter steynii TaxID=430522 RepID=A0A1H0EGP5_9SPHI|nr:hypothetical protein SAMN05421820_109282 [Pedobacter steynii]